MTISNVRRMMEIDIPVIKQTMSRREQNRVCELVIDLLEYSVQTSSTEGYGVSRLKKKIQEFRTLHDSLNQQAIAELAKGNLSSIEQLSPELQDELCKAAIGTLNQQKSTSLFGRILEGFSEEAAGKAETINRLENYQQFLRTKDLVGSESTTTIGCTLQ